MQKCCFHFYVVLKLKHQTVISLIKFVEYSANLIHDIEMMKFNKNWMK